MAEHPIDTPGGPLVFVLDDDPTFHHLIRGYLHRARPDVTVRAFLRLEDLVCHPDLLLADLFVVDINLAQGLSGFDVPARLPAICRFAAFLFISGYLIKSDEYRRAASLPLFDFLAKPFDDVQFLHRAEMLLSARFKTSPGIDDRLFARLSASPFLAVVVDAEGRVDMANQYAADYLDVSGPRHLIGRRLADFMAELAEIPTETPEFTAEIQTAAGASRTIHWLRTPFIDTGRDPLALLVGMPEATRRRKADRLREIYQEIIARDRTVIRAIQPIKAPACAGRE